MAQVTLRMVDAANRPAIEALQVAAPQERFVDSVRESLLEAEACSPPPWCRAIYAEQTPVGFLMLADNDPTFRWPYFLWRLLVDQRYQRRGYGAAALDLLVAYVKTHPGAERLVTSVAIYGDARDEYSPMKFYLKYGFEPTGEVNDRELVIELPL